MYINKDIVMTIKFMPQFEMHTACKVPSHMVPHLILRGYYKMYLHIIHIHIMDF